MVPEIQTSEVKSCGREMLCEVSWALRQGTKKRTTALE